MRPAGRLRECKASCLPHPEPDYEGGWLKLPPGGEKVKKKTQSIQYTPSQPLPFCLLCVTNLECPAGTNYSILMSAVSKPHLALAGVLPLLPHADQPPSHLRSPFPTTKLPAGCLLEGWTSPCRVTRVREPSGQLCEYSEFAESKGLWALWARSKNQSGLCLETDTVHTCLK